MSGYISQRDLFLLEIVFLFLFFYATNGLPLEKLENVELKANQSAFSQDNGDEVCHHFRTSLSRRDAEETSESQDAPLVNLNKSSLPKDSSPKSTSIIHFKSNVTRIYLTAIHVDQAEFPLSRLLFKLTLRLALESANKLLENDQLKLILSVRSADKCFRQFAGAIAAEEYHSRRARCFLVSGCDDATRAVSRLASEWRLPIITAAGLGADLDDRSVHKTLIRVAFSLRKAVEFLFRLLKHFQWRRVNMIVDESDPISFALKNNIERYFIDGRLNAAQKHGPTATNYTLQLKTIPLDFRLLIQDYGDLRTARFSSQMSEPKGLDAAETRSRNASLLQGDRWPNELMGQVIRDSLRQSSLFSRVTILLIPERYLRNFMLSVHEENMANGLYTFLNLPLIPTVEQTSTVLNDSKTFESHSGRLPVKQQPNRSSASNGDGVYLWRLQGSSRNLQARQAFESLMSIYLKTPTSKTYLSFVSRLNNLIEGRKSLEINPYIASFYDALQLYASAIKESLNERRKKTAKNANSTNLSFMQSDPTTSGKDLFGFESEGHFAISNLIKNRQYQNMLTGHMSINSNGDRESDYTLDDMNHMTGKFAPVILYRGETNTLERIGRIHWSSDASIGPTIDSVECGLDGSCQRKPMSKFTLVLLLVASKLLIILASIVYFIHNRLSLESQLVDHWWKIQLGDIELVLTRRKNANDGSLVMASDAMGHSQGADEMGSMNLAAVEVERSNFRAESSLADNLGPSGAKGQHGAASESVTTAPAIAPSGMSMLISAGGRFRSSTVVTGQSSAVKNSSISLANKTETSRTTNVSMTQASKSQSVIDVCYGDITLGIYKLAKVAIKPIGDFQQSRKLMLELTAVSNEVGRTIRLR